MTIDFIKRTIRHLQIFNVEFLVTGGCAKIIREEVEFTSDLDILVKKSKKNYRCLNKCIKSLTNKTINVENDMLNDRIIRLNIFPFNVDILPKLDGLDSPKVFRECEIIFYHGISIPTISKENLDINYKSF